MIKYIYYDNNEPKNNFYFFGGVRISNAKVQLKKNKSEKEYEIEKVDYLDDFKNEVLSVEYIKNVPQFQKNPKFKLVRSSGKIKNPYIEPAWKQNEDGTFSKIISEWEYCNDFSYHAKYEANGYFFRRFNNNYQDCIEVYKNEENYQKQCIAIKEKKEYIDYTFERQLYRYENHFLNIRNLKYYKIYELDFSLNGMQVLDKSGQKLGKIYDTVFATETFTIEQLCIKRPFLKSFSDAELLMHRNQIIEINRDSVIVRNQTESSDINKSHTVLQNPFRSRRQNSPQTGTINPSMK